MKTTTLARGLAVGLMFLSVNTICVAADQAPTKSNKLGFGFAPGLIPGKDYVAGQLIVGYKEGVSTQSIAQTATGLGGQKIQEIKGTAMLLQFASEAVVEAAAPFLIMGSNVLFVERNGIVRLPPEPQLPQLKKGSQGKSPGDIGIQSVSADGGTGYQWHHTVIRKTAALPALSATPPTVAVIDTGVDYTHPDLAGKVILGKNVIDNNFDPYDDNSHGTHVAGIIAAKAGNGGYGEGVCPNCKILAVKVLDASGSGTDFDVAAGMHYAHSAATSPATRVINMSLGGTGNSLTIATEVDHIKAAGKILVAAAGNSNDSTTPHFPGADPDTALRVMSTESNDCRSNFSNFSPSATPSLYNIAAPGSEIYSTLPFAGFGPLSGTSMASPVVAGTAALVWGQIPSLTRDGLVTRILNTGKPIACGFAAATRRVDVRKAIIGTSEVALVGRILDPFTGKPPSPPTVPTTAVLVQGATFLKSDATNPGGLYEMTGLTTGTGRLLRGNRSGYVNAILRPGLSIASGVAGPFTDALPKARAAGNATVTLDWRNMEPFTDTAGCVDSCQGAEFDLFVKLPNGSYIEPFFNQGNLTTTPFVINPRDSIDDFEPLETIVIGSGAANGVYKVFVDKFPFDGSIFDPSWTGSEASVQFFNGAASIGTFFPRPPAACETLRYWHVANLTKSGTSYTFTNVNTCTNTKP